MAVFRIDKTRDYTVMSNHHLRNTSLSLKAKGLLSLMLSLPDNWDYTTRGLARICKDGIDSICAGVRELEDQGYVLKSTLEEHLDVEKGLSTLLQAVSEKEDQVLLKDADCYFDYEMNEAQKKTYEIWQEAKALEKCGIKRQQLVAKIAGGAAMFQFSGKTDLASVGERNVKAVKEVLAAFKIPIVAEDTGKDYGRTIVFDNVAKKLTIRSAGKGEKVI